MHKYKKKPVEVKIEAVTEPQTISTLEGSQDIQSGQYLVTSVKGEQYAISPEIFSQYVPASRENYFYKPAAQEPVWAFKLSQPVEIFRPDWQHKGKTGDYLIIKDNEQYVVNADVFSLSYDEI